MSPLRYDRAMTDPDETKVLLDGDSDDPGRTRPLAPARYQLGQTIGRGGMGVIIAARDMRIDREVAIKRLRRDRMSSSMVARFVREARIQGQLEHPAIPPVHELGHDTDGVPFFAMKKLSGTTLSQILRDPDRPKKFPRERLLRAFADVCLAVELAHTRGVVHRDLKPANVLLGDFGEVYVLDWGIAKVAREPEPEPEPERPPTPSDAALEPDLTAPGMTMGTPGYMAPEQQTLGVDVDGRADVYSLGCLLHEILTGIPHHTAAAGAGDVPPELQELCASATAVDRDARIGSARELADRVLRYLDGDRDLALRRDLAEKHLATAVATLGDAGAGDDEARRRTAMREAGQALALDPTLQGAAELVGRLMLEAPRVMPRPVAEELAAIDRDTARSQARIGMITHLGLLALAIVLYAIGARDPVPLGALAAVCAINIAINAVGLRRASRGITIATIGFGLLTITVIARLFSPFLIAPGIGVVTLMSFAFHPAAATPRNFAITAALGAAAVVGVYLAEAIGAISPTLTTSGGVIAMTPPIHGIEAVPFAPALCAYSIVLAAAGGLLAGTVARAERTARSHLHLQAWQLRQLLPIS